MHDPGLTSDAVAERVAAGKVNRVDDSSSRSLGEIVRSNVLTRFNALITVLAVVVLVVGEPRDVLFAIVMVFNAVIGIAQELRSKRTLDRLSVVAAPRLTVVRDGRPVVVERTQVVLDDVVVLVVVVVVLGDVVVVSHCGSPCSSGEWPGGHSGVVVSPCSQFECGGGVWTGGLGYQSPVPHSGCQEGCESQCSTPRSVAGGCG